MDNAKNIQKTVSNGVQLALAAAACFLLSQGCLHASFRGKVNSGNRQYNAQKYDKAMERYRDALIDDPESRELHFNMGDALYKQENYEDAMKEYEKATYSKDIRKQAYSYYNMGNCLYKLGKLPESIQLYKKALEMNPGDEDAKYNIEFVQKKIKENMQKKPQDQKQQQNQQQKKQQQQQKQEKDQKNQKDQEQQQRQDKQKKGMSKEDAKRLMQAFDENEKDAQKKKKMQAQGASSGPDW